MSVDWILGLSQGKAALQLLAGDVEGAKRTTQNFCRECPGVAQVTSFAQLVDGDKEGAWETQKRSLRTVDNIANAIPVVGCPKAAVHHVCGDRESRNRALYSSTRSTVALGTAAATGGGLAVIGSNLVFDGIATAATRRCQGTYRSIDDYMKEPSVGTLYDATYSITSPVVDPVIFRPCSRRGVTRVEPM